MASLTDKAADLLGQAVVAALVGLLGSIAYLWTGFAVLDDNFNGIRRELAAVRVDFQEFRKPGARFTANDGKRIQKQIDSLKEEFRTFHAAGSRFSPLGRQLQIQINECKEEMHEARDVWVQCITFHEGVKARLDFLEDRE